MTGPIHEHDCDVCKYLGTVNNQDLYFCPSDLGGPTVICRYGKAGDYRSGLVFGLDKDNPLHEALKRALKVMEYRRIILKHFDKYERETSRWCALLNLIAEVDLG